MVQTLKLMRFDIKSNIKLNISEHFGSFFPSEQYYSILSGWEYFSMTFSYFQGLWYFWGLCWKKNLSHENFMEKKYGKLRKNLKIWETFYRNKVGQIGILHFALFLAFSDIWLSQEKCKSRVRKSLLSKAELWGNIFPVSWFLGLSNTDSYQMINSTTSLW